jgi:uncharacterized protein (DUF2147 family)
MLSFIFVLGMALPAFAQTQSTSAANEVLGFWHTRDNRAKVKIYKCGDGSNYCGKIIWLKEPYKSDGKTPKTDENNPDASKRNTPVIGLPILHSFVFDSKANQWVDGKIYDPDNGKTYSCKMWLDGNNTLQVRGYVGMSLLGRTEVWKRTTE